MDLPTYIKEKRTEFEGRLESSRKFGFVGGFEPKFLVDFYVDSLTQLVEKMEEWLLAPESAWVKEIERRGDYVGAGKETAKLILAEIRRRFHLFKTGEEHTGV